MSWSTIINVILTHGLNISSFIFLVIVIIYLIIYLTRRITKWTNTVDGYDGRIKKVENIQNIVVELKAKIDLMFNMFSKAGTFGRDLFVEANSPISLNDTGKEVAKEISAESMFQKYKDKWSDSVDETNPKNAYDIQQSSFDVVRAELFDSLMDDDLAKLKDVAFKHGVLVEHFTSIFGVYLRDYILEKRDIPISDVDKHGPKDK